MLTGCLTDVHCYLRESKILFFQFLRKMPPTSLKVTLRALNLGARQTLVECLQTEFLLMQRLSAEHDFEQGLYEMSSIKIDMPRVNYYSLKEFFSQVFGRCYTQKTKVPNLILQESKM